MNSFVGIGTYTGESYHDSGLRFMGISMPKVGKSGSDVPLLMVPNKAAGETFDVFQPGVRLLLGGRLYPNRQDYKMYLVPNQPLQLVNDKSLQLNRVNLAGGVGFIPEQAKEDLFTFTTMVSAPAQMILGHNWEDSLSFRMESWGDDAKRLTSLLHVGRQLSVEGVLRYNLWQAQDGSQRGTYQVRVRAGMYSVFGKNKNREEQAKVKNGLSEENLCSPASVSKPPAQPARKAYAPAVDEDSVPF